MQESHGIPLDTSDPADLPRCPMERLADRLEDAPRPKWLRVWAVRSSDGTVAFGLNGMLATPENIEDLINYLARVKG